MKFRAREDVAHHILKQHPGQAVSNISNRSQGTTSISNSQQNDSNQHNIAEDESTNSMTGV